MRSHAIPMSQMTLKSYSIFEDNDNHFDDDENGDDGGDVDGGNNFLANWV